MLIILCRLGNAIARQKYSYNWDASKWRPFQTEIANA